MRPQLNPPEPDDGAYWAVIVIMPSGKAQPIKASKGISWEPWRFTQLGAHNMVKSLRRQGWPQPNSVVKVLTKQ